MENIDWTKLIWILSMLPIGIFLGCSLVYVFNHIPVAWLCDYDKEPTGDLARTEERRKNGDRGAQRIPGMPWKLVLSAFFIVIGIYLITIGGHGGQYALPLLIIIWLLMITAISDGKYKIIPDQFVVFLALMSCTLIPFGMPIKDMLLGAVAGTVIMLIVAAAGYFISHRESLGFGDVKLMAAIGLVTGLYPCLGIMVLAAIISGMAFFTGIISKRIKLTDSVALGPYLAGCAIASLVLL
ncbi:MAG: prepilin peptidase [Firmicutes bacterium]|nr:prepilin peptidase [Bacillota bacterium]